MSRQKEKHPLRMLILVTQIGITMLVSVFFSAWLGSLIMKKTGSELLFVLFLVLGILAGFRSCYHIIRRFAPLGSTGLRSGGGLRSNGASRMENCPEPRMEESTGRGTFHEDDPGDRPDDLWEP